MNFHSTLSVHCIEQVNVFLILAGCYGVGTTQTSFGYDRLLKERLAGGVFNQTGKAIIGRYHHTEEFLARKIQKRSYQFCRKGNGEQFKFNSVVEDHLKVAAKELSKLAVLCSEEERNIIQCTKDHLDEGIKTIVVRQKHIKIADRLDLEWAVVKAYMDDELTSDIDNEKKLYKANHETHQAVKKKRAESAAAAVKKRATETSSLEPPVVQGRFNQKAQSPVIRPRMVGPCYRCGKLGHLVANCPSNSIFLSSLW